MKKFISLFKAKKSEEKINLLPHNETASLIKLTDNQIKASKQIAMLQNLQTKMNKEKDAIDMVFDDLQQNDNYDANIKLAKRILPKNIYRKLKDSIADYRELTSLLNDYIAKGYLKDDPDMVGYVQTDVNTAKQRYFEKLDGLRVSYEKDTLTVSGLISQNQEVKCTYGSFCKPGR